MGSPDIRWNVLSAFKASHSPRPGDEELYANQRLADQNRRLWLDETCVRWGLL